MVSDRPVDGKAIARRGLKIKAAPALGFPAPHKGFATDLVAPDPVEGFFLNIRVFLILNEKMLG